MRAAQQELRVSLDRNAQSSIGAWHRTGFNPIEAFKKTKLLKLQVDMLVQLRSKGLSLLCDSFDRGLRDLVPRRYVCPRHIS